MDPSKNPVDPNKSPPTGHNAPQPGGSSSSSSATSPAKRSNIVKDDEDEQILSEMIDEVLNPRPDAMQPERFNMSLVHDSDAGTAAAPDPRRFGERDYQSHRRESFPHIHHPLRPLHSRSLRKKLVTSPVKHHAHGTVSPLPTELSSSPPTGGMMVMTAGGGAGADGGNNEDSLTSSTATSTPTLSGKVPGSSEQSSSSADHAHSRRRHYHHHRHEEPDVEPEEAYESCPLLGEPELELYNLDLAVGESSGDVVGVGNVPTPHSASSPVPGPFDDLIEPVKKVQFEIGGSPVAAGPGEPHERRKHRKHSHHHVKYEDPQWRLRQGSELVEEGMSLQRYDMTQNELDELAPEMSSQDRDELTAHRFADNKGFRRHRFYFKSPEEGGQPEVTIVAAENNKPIYDHQPHEVYVEMDMLHVRGHLREWKETARWIKYEEDLEEGADRWGRPHVASLSFHSLINLRRLIEAGVTILDLEERDLPGVAYRVVAAMALHELISDEDKPLVMKSLLSKHKHVNDDERPWRFHLRRNTHSGSLTSLHAMLEDARNRNGRHNAPVSNVEAAFEGLTRRSSAASRLGGSDGGHNDFQYSPIHHKNGTGSPTRSFSVRGVATSATDSNLNQQHKGQHVAISLAKYSLSNLSEEDIKWISNKESILRRIPLGAEASIVLVGQDDALEQPVLAFVRLAEAVIMPNTTELPIPVRFVFVVLGPPSIDLDYKEIGRSISTLMANTHFHEIAYKANDRKDMLKGIHEFLDESIVLPPGELDAELFPFDELREKSEALRRRKERRRSIAKGLLDPGDGGGDPPYKDGDEDPLQRTRRPFGGLVNDVKRRYPLYLSDITDGLNFQIIASILFIYFACVSGAIAFGGVLNDRTEGHIGITETLMASAGGSIAFALFGGQPLITVGTTGPLYLFDVALYNICKVNELDFLAFRIWIGIWAVLIATAVVAAEGSVLARYFTRFIQEIYSAFISLLFCWECIEKLILTYEKHPLMLSYDTYNSTDISYDAGPQPNTALLTSILCLGTFIFGIACRGIRDSDYFTPCIRKFLGNFGVPIGIAVMCMIDLLLVNHASTAKLKVPEGLSTTKNRTSWLVDPSPVPVGWIFLGVFPGFLVFILMFMETSICGRLIAKKEHKLVKGTGFHLDVILVTLANVGCTVIGGSWVCAATVRSVAHATSLIVYSTNNAPGEKPVILGVQEQRISSLGIGLLLGVSVFMSPILVKIPMAVLFGVFLYMGISSMRGVQLFDRISLLFKQVSSHPQVPYVRRVRTSKMHLFTVIQIACLAVLWGVKSSIIAIAVPLVLMTMVPFRMLAMPRIFKTYELQALDSDGSEPPAPKISTGGQEASIMLIQDGNMNKLQNGSGPVKNGIPEIKELRTIS